MKKAIIVLSLALLFVGCDGYSSANCYNQVEMRYPKSTIQMIGDFKFIVVDSSGDTHYIETMGTFSAAPTKDILIKTKK